VLHTDTAIQGTLTIYSCVFV